MPAQIFYKRITTLLLGVLLVVQGFALPLAVEAAPNLEINYQGKLTDSSGVAVADGTYAIVFKLYDASSGGNTLWTENRTGANEVTVTNGLFSVMLGEVASLASVDFNQTVYLGVTIESDTEMTPRKKLGSVPSAFEAQKLGGVASSSFLRSDASDEFTAGNTLTVSGTLDSNGDISIADTSIAFDGATTNFATTGNFSLNTSQFFVNQSTGNIGIGTSSPSVKLDITVGSGVDGFKIARSDGERSIWLVDNGSGVGSLYLFNGSNSNTAYITGSGNSFFNGGSVGIGTSTPATTFAVVGTGRITGALTLDSTLSATGLATFSSGISVNSETFTDLTGTGLALSGGALTVSGLTTSHFSSAAISQWTNDANYIATSTFDTSAELAAIVGDETGSGALVFGTSPTLVTPDLGTPSAITLTNATGLPVSTGISGLGTGIATWLATPSSSNFAAAVTGETGTGNVVFSASPTFTGTITAASASLSAAGGTGVLTVTATNSSGQALALNAPSDANHLNFQTSATTKWTQYLSGNDLRFFETGYDDRLTLQSGGNVGIGTTSPSAKLAVAGTGRFTGALTLDSTLGVTGATSLSTLTTTGTSTFATSGGKVGIGTASPLGNLHIYSASSLGGSISTSADELLIEGVSPGMTFLSRNTGSSQIYFGDAESPNAGAILYSHASDYLSFSTVGSARMRIDSSGNVGIGTTSPAYILDVAGTGRFTGNVRIDSNLRDNRDNAIIQQSASSLLSGRDLTIGNATYANILLPSGNIGIGTTSPSARLHVANAGEGLVALMNTSASSNGTWAISVGSGGQLGHGQLGIGPGTTFSATTGAIRFSTGGSVSIGNSSAAILTSAANYFDLRPNISITSGGTGIGILTNSGGVLAPTSGTTQSLAVGLNFAPTSGTGIFHALALTPTINQTGGANGITRGIYVNPTLTAAADFRGVEIANNSGFGLYQSGASATNYFAGNVGIGTTTPSSKLHVQGDITLGGVNTDLVRNILADGNQGKVQICGDNNTTTCARIVLHGSSRSSGPGDIYATLGSNGTGFHFESVAGTEIMTLKSSGNVGIGTTTPLSKLHVYDTTPVLTIEGAASTPTTAINFRNSGGTISTISHNMSSGEFKIGATGGTGHYLTFYEDGNERMRIDSSGNVGIGTVSPGARLAIQGTGTTSASTALMLQDSDGTRWFTAEGDGKIYFGSNTASSVYLAPHATSAGSINKAGTNLSFVTRNASGTTFGDAFKFRTENNILTTTGTSRMISIEPTFAPTSGTGVFENISLRPTINQTGGANGITRGIYVNPTLTAAADFRGVEIANNSGFGLYQSGASATNYFAGNVGIGTTTPSAKLHTLATTEQLRLGYDASNYASFTTGATGGLTLGPTNGSLTIARPAGSGDASLTLSGGTAGNATLNLTAAGSLKDGRVVITGTDRAYVTYTNTNSFNTGMLSSTSLWGVSTTTSSSNYLLSVSTNGNVGIGTGSTAPTGARLSSIVSDSTTSQYSNTSAGLLVSNTDTTTNNWTGIFMADDIAGTAATAIQTKFTDHTNNYGELHFTTHGASGLATKMMIDQNGNVGIGTTSPAYPLSVAGVINSTSGYYIGGTQYLSGTAALGNIFAGPNAAGGGSVSGQQNSFFGLYSGHDTTSGGYNTFLGANSGRYNSTGQNNNFMGYTAGYNNLSGAQNIAIGNGALYTATSTSYLVAVGHGALYNNTSGTLNTAIGSVALNANTTGAQNSALGYAALTFNTTGSNNTASGYAALYANTTGSANAAFGASALEQNTTGIYNTAIGYRALYIATSTSYNTAVGGLSLTANTSGTNNTAVGYGSMVANTTGSYNVAIGQQALGSNTTGGLNNAVGYYALSLNTTGVQNNAFGQWALMGNITGAGNVALGDGALKTSTSTSYQVAIGTSALNANTSGAYNNALGTNALLSNTTGSYNNSFGYGVLGNNTIGSTNSGFGHYVLGSNTTGSGNTSIGSLSMHLNTTGGNNVAVGGEALYGNITGSYNVGLGYGALYTATSSTQNTAIGHNALYSNTSGINNSALGFQSMYNNTTGSNNIAFGGHTLLANTTGSYNTAMGMYSLRANTTGGENTALGYAALYNATSTSYNTAVGYGALYSTDAGGFNSALGHQSLFYNTTGSNNSALGFQALIGNTTGSQNSAFGYQALQSNTTAGHNNAFGFYALKNTTTGQLNSAVGSNALFGNIEGTGNVGIGYGSLYTATSTNYQTAVGYQALYSNTSGTYNTALGFQSLYANTAGSFNSAFGYGALDSVTIGNGNSGIGNYAGSSITSGENNTVLGLNALSSVTTQSSNTAVGSAAMYNYTGASGVAIGLNAQFYGSGSSNVAVGQNAHFGVNGQTTGTENVAVGQQSLYSVTTGGYNTGVGTYSLYNNSTGIGNSALGRNAGRGITTGQYNTALGYHSMYTGNATGSYNIAIGTEAMNAAITGSGNIGIGYQALYAAAAATNNSVLGYQSGLSITSGQNNVLMGALSGKSLTTTHNNVMLGASAGESEAGAENVYIGYAAGYDSTSRTRTGNVFIGNYAGRLETGSNKLHIANSHLRTDDYLSLIYGEFGDTGITNQILKFNAKVGIGQGDGVNPGTLLHAVAGGDANLATLERTTGGYFLSHGFSSSNPYTTYYGSSYYTIGYGTGTHSVPSVNTLVLESGGDVGLGTTNPTSKLEVNSGNIEISNEYGMNTDISGTLRNVIGRFNTTQLYVGAAGGWSSIIFQPGAAETMRITSDSKVGIGTSTPTSKLQVVSTTEQLRLGYDASNYASFTTNSTGHLGIVPSGDRLGIGTASPSFFTHIRKDQNSSTDVVLQNSGAGTASRTTLQVNGDSGYGTKIYSFGTGYTTSALFVANRSVIDSNNTNGIFLGASDSSGYVGFYSGGYNERMRISSAGNVGIGTTVATSKLDINGINTGITADLGVAGSGTGVASLALYRNAGGGAAELTNIKGYAKDSAGNLQEYGSIVFHSIDTTSGTEDGALAFRTALNGTSAEKMRIDENGTLLINTTTSNTAYKLDAAGAIRGQSGLVAGTGGALSTISIPNGAGSSVTPQIGSIQTSGQASMAVGVIDGTNNHRAGLFVDHTNSAWGLSDTYSSSSAWPFVIRNNGSESLRISSAGNVSIGNTNNTYKLEVTGTGYFSGNVSLEGTNSTIRRITGPSDDNLLIRSASGRDLMMGAANDHLIIKTTTGNVGIGTGTTVSAKLHVLGTTEQLRLGYDTSNYVPLTVSSSGYLGMVPTGERFGIGTNSPNVTLDIRSAVGAVNLTSTTGTNTTFFDIINTGGTFRIGQERSTGGGLITGSSAYDGVISIRHARNLHLGTNSAINMTIDSAGDVGIGATSPTEKLQVEGNLRFSGASGSYVMTDTQQNALYIPAGYVAQKAQAPSGFRIEPSSTSNVPLVVAGADGHSTELTHWTNYGGTLLASITSAGGGYFSGSVGIGTTTPTTGKLVVHSTDTSAAASLALGGDNGVIASMESINMIIDSDNTQSNRGFYVSNNTGGYSGTNMLFSVHESGTVQLNAYGAGTLETDASGNITAGVSDERLKDIQGQFSLGLDVLMNINPIAYKWNQSSGFETEHTYYGFSAQNIRDFMPDVVKENSQGYLSFSDRPLLAASINAIKELNLKITDLETNMASSTQEKAPANGIPTINALVERVADRFGALYENGRTIFARIFTREVVIAETEGMDDAAGDGVIPEGELFVEIRNSLVNENSKIFITPTSPLRGNAWFISLREEGKFVLELEESAMTEFTFDYFIVSVDKDETEEIEEGSNEPAPSEPTPVVEEPSPEEGSDEPSEAAPIVEEEPVEPVPAAEPAPEVESEPETEASIE